MTRAHLGHHDSLSLAQEKLQQAELLFFALERLLDDPTCLDHARRLAAMGGTTCQDAAIDLDEKVQALLSQEVHS